MKTTAKPTPGPWKVHDPATARPSARGGIDNRLMVIHPDGERLICDLSTGYHGSKGPIPEAERLANAELIAEAGTVYHETGLSPREILAQRDSLMEILARVRYMADCHEPNEETLAKIYDQTTEAESIQNASKGGEKEPRFENVGCSQCGRSFGPGDHGFSHCENHAGLKGER